MKPPAKAADTKREIAREKLIRRSVSHGRTIDETAAAVRAAGLPRSSRASVARDVAALRGRQKVRRVDAKRPPPAAAPAAALDDGLPSDAEIVAETSLQALGRWLARAEALAKIGEDSKDPPLLLRASDLATKILAVRLRVDPPPPPPAPQGNDGDAVLEKLTSMLDGIAVDQKYRDDVTASELPARIAAGATGPGSEPSPREEGMWIGVRTMRGEHYPAPPPPWQRQAATAAAREAKP
jgi:hypothetical protein